MLDKVLHSCTGKKNAVLNQAPVIKTKEIKPTSSQSSDVNEQWNALPLT